MSAGRGAVAAGKTRACPHCKATILESAGICPACLHHLRFDPGQKSGPAPGIPAFRVEGAIKNSESVGRWEYAVVVAIRDAQGAEVSRHVVNVGALAPQEQRRFAVSVEVFAKSGL
jgi:hypothetical protein